MPVLHRPPESDPPTRVPLALTPKSHEETEVEEPTQPISVDNSLLYLQYLKVAPNEPTSTQRQLTPNQHHFALKRRDPTLLHSLKSASSTAN